MNTNNFVVATFLVPILGSLHPFPLLLSLPLFPLLPVPQPACLPYLNLYTAPTKPSSKNGKPRGSVFTVMSYINRGIVVPNHIFSLLDSENVGKGLSPEIAFIALEPLRDVPLTLQAIEGWPRNVHVVELCVSRV